MTRGPGGYGRYNDEPGYVGCPRAKSDMSPCAARDGQLACADSGVCVSCGQHPAELLRDLVREVTGPAPPAAFARKTRSAADPGTAPRPSPEAGKTEKGTS